MQISEVKNPNHDKSNSQLECAFKVGKNMKWSQSQTSNSNKNNIRFKPKKYLQNSQDQCGTVKTPTCLEKQKRHREVKDQIYYEVFGDVDFSICYMNHRQ